MNAICIFRLRLTVIQFGDVHCIYLSIVQLLPVFYKLLWEAHKKRLECVKWDVKPYTLTHFRHRSDFIKACSHFAVLSTMGESSKVLINDSDSEIFVPDSVSSQYYSLLIGWW